jgi:hypothetical protein
MRENDKAIGRPSTYSDEVGVAICERIAQGETLSQVCASPGMPARATVYRWQEANLEFRDTYRRARELQMQSWADEIVLIADDTTLDTVTKVTPQGREYETVDHENIQRSKLRVNTRQWLMARLNPRLYGDKVEHEHSGLVGHAHIHGTLDDKEKARRLATFLLQAGQGAEVLESLGRQAAHIPADQEEESGGIE